MKRMFPFLLVAFRHFHNVQIIIVHAILALGENGLRNLLHSDVVVAFIQTYIESRCANQQALESIHFFGKAVQHSRRQVLCRDVNEAVILAVSLFPENLRVRSVKIAIHLCNRRHKHLGIVFIGKDIISMLVLDNQSRGEFIELVSSAALPFCSLSNSTGIGTVNNSLEPWSTMCVTMIAKFNAYPSSLKFCCRSCCRSRAKERI